MTSQLVIFKAFFSRPPDPKSEKKIPVNRLIKKLASLLMLIIFLLHYINI